MWRVVETPYNYKLVENEGGKVLAYSPASGIGLIEKDGFAFKDLARTGELLPYEDWRLPAEERAEDLAQRLSVRQIAGLMCFSAHQRTVAKELNEEQKTFLNQHLRSILNFAFDRETPGAHTPNSLQIAWANAMQEYVEGRNFGIPCYFASDPRNGHGTADWPGNLGLAATFDPDLAGEAARCISRELRDLGITCFLAPQVDVACDPRWWRDSGTFGEDPALSRDMTRAFCDGLQSTWGEDGEDLGWGPDSVTAMVKHWTGEGAGEGGREAHTEGGKYAVYPGGNFEALMIPFVDGAFRLNGRTGSAASVMSSYTAAWSDDGSLGEIVGSGFSNYKLNELLRKRFGFSGPVCTDWMVLNEGPRKCGWGKKIEDDNATPGMRAFWSIMAGADQMGGCSNPQVLMDAYEYGCAQVGRDVMDKAFARSARRLLVNYFLTGIFENPYIDEEKAGADINSADKQAAALDAQVKSVVMLKNTNGAIRPHERRIRVYIPATFKAAHWTTVFMGGIVDFPEKAEYLIDPEIARRYFDVVTDTIEGTRIIRAPKDEVAGCDLVLIMAEEPQNGAPQDAIDKKGEFIPLTRQYGPYVANGPNVRRVSIAGDIAEDGTKQNRSYYGRSAYCSNAEQLDQILEAAALAKELGIPSAVAMITGKPLCFHEFEPAVDAILVNFSGSAEALCRIAAGVDEPSGLLPMQMPRDMDAVEKHLEDVPRGMTCYTDTQGHCYDFAYGMNYSGVIDDARVRRYSAPPLTRVGESRVDC